MREDSVSDYLDELLQPAPQQLDSELFTQPEPAEPLYTLVSIGGLRLLVPPAHADRLHDTPATGGSLATMDIRPILFPPGHPARNRPAEPKCWLLLPSKSMQLWFETNEGSVDLDPAAVSWRQEPGARPWLRGTVVSLKAAIIDPEMLADTANIPPSGAIDG